jgi:hypothetical protein
MHKYHINFDSHNQQNVIFSTAILKSTNSCTVIKPT